MYHYLIDLGPHTLEVETHTPADQLDEEFEATCIHTGERLVICGWLIDNIEVVDSYEGGG